MRLFQRLLSIYYLMCGRVKYCIDDQNLLYLRNVRGAPRGSVQKGRYFTNYLLTGSPVPLEEKERDSEMTRNVGGRRDDLPWVCVDVLRGWKTFKSLVAKRAKVL